MDSETLQIIAEEFSTMIRGDVKVHSFYEEMGMAGLYGLHGKVTSILGILFFGTDNGFIDRRRLLLYYRRCSGRQRRHKWESSQHGEVLK